MFQVSKSDENLTMTKEVKANNEDEARLESLFKKLDSNSDGKIDIHDLAASLKELGLSEQYAEVSRCMEKSIANRIFPLVCHSFMF